MDRAKWCYCIGISGSRIYSNIDRRIHWIGSNEGEAGQVTRCLAHSPEGFTLSHPFGLPSTPICPLKNPFLSLPILPITDFLEPPRLDIYTAPPPIPLRLLQPHLLCLGFFQVPLLQKPLVWTSTRVRGWKRRDERGCELVQARCKVCESVVLGRVWWEGAGCPNLSPRALVRREVDFGVPGAIEGALRYVRGGEDSARDGVLVVLVPERGLFELNVDVGPCQRIFDRHGSYMLKVFVLS